jgi:Protein of unknown function (DUF1549)/Planctomycete cytochrome C
MATAARLPRLAAFILLAVAGTAPARAADQVSFNRDIRPILSDKCFHCHGPDAKTREADLRLDTREGLFSEIDDIFPVVPGQPEKSELLLRVRSIDKDEVMPPPKAHKTVKPEEIALLEEWIRQGAEFQGHWSFVAPVKPPVPEIRDPQSAIRNPIDAFLRAALPAKGLAPSGEAAKEVLIRRVTFDLTGLPPTLEEVDTFLSDTAPDAYERLVDRVLASPHYGEHMAKHWLDVARYGDTHGLHLDNERSMWPYRDWVVQAFNQNLPFDRFTEWQVAGDLLPKPTPDQLVASGFNRCNVTTSEGGSINEELLVRYAIDRTTVMAETFLGLTAGCAVCHDHKFDPVSQKEFYELYAFFNSAADPAMDGNILLTPPIYTLTTPEQQRQLDDFDAKTASAEKRLNEMLAKVEYTDPATLTPPPEKTTRETLWFDDELPAKAVAKVNGGNHPLWWVTADDGQIASGQRALKRMDKGVAQDYFTGITPPIYPPATGKIFVHAWLDPADPPQTIMVQFHTDKWSHRVAWGDIDKIGYGAKGSAERLHKGQLPKLGEWVRLEVNVSEFKLPADTKFTGFAFTQFGGTVFWDKLGVSYVDDPVNDNAQSQTAWEKFHQGKARKELPKDLQTIFRSVNPKEHTPEHTARLRQYYLAEVHRETSRKLTPMTKEIAGLKTKREDYVKTIPATLVMADLPQPRTASAGRNFGVPGCTASLG